MAAKIQDNIVMRLNHKFFRYRAYLITNFDFAGFLIVKKKIHILHLSFFDTRSTDLSRNVSLDIWNDCSNVGNILLSLLLLSRPSRN